MQSIFLLLGLFADAISASPLGQQPLGRLSPTELPSGQLAEGLRKPVRGRFLHITGRRQFSMLIFLLCNLMLTNRFPSRPPLQARNLDRSLVPPW